MGRRSRSRSRRRSKRVQSSDSSESRPKKDFKKIGQAPEAPSDGDMTGGEEEGRGSMSLEAKNALLEVENATLKTENRELKKKLVELLNSGRASGASSSKPKEAEKPVDRRLARAAAAEKYAGEAPPAERRRERSPPKAEPEPKARKAPPPMDEAPPDDMRQNAIMLVNNSMEAYNEQVPNNIALEKRLPLVNEKLDRFLGNFDAKVQILDLKTGGAILKDMKMFTMRYGCVFRESGSKLKGITTKRFYWDSEGRKPSYSLDYETHESLVTAMAGTPQDGKLGVRDPRTEYLIVLYEEKGGKITKMWLKPDVNKLGKDPTANESILACSEEFKAFEAKIAQLRGKTEAHTIFHNYHETPSVG